MVPATKEAEAGSITTGLLWQLSETQVLKKKVFLKAVQGAG